MRGALRRTRPTSPTDRWRDYLAGVEPALVARPRLHRFALPPVLGDPDTRPLPLAVWIDGDGDREGDAATRTRAALQRGSVAPSMLLGGPLKEALAGTRGERVMLVRAGDEPAPLALERLGQAAALAPDAAIITCDEDELSPLRARRFPRFRPGPSPDRWLACDDSGALLVVAREPAGALLGELAGGDAWRHELALNLAGRASERHAHVPMLLCHRAGEGPEDPPLPAATLARTLKRWAPRARVEQIGALRRIRRPLVGEPSVELIVCFRDQPELLSGCVGSILADSAYERLRVTLVDNGSTDAETSALLAKLAADARVRVLSDARPFNFAALNNLAAASSEADALLFLNNDTEVVDRDWIATLLEEALRPEVGAVAPLLLYPDGTVQHAGAAIGLHDYAGHPFAGLMPDADTPFGQADAGTRNWLAVTAACMMVQRSKFVAAGGFDESFVVAGNDVDLCLRLTSAGHRSLCVPHTRLLHAESRSRGSHVDPGDFAASERSYGEFRTIGDPFYNPNLTLHATDCRVRTPDETPA